ncbi:MAG TPA: hypothetical protein VFL07_07355, partial [Rudaea sp.]|nr:hypothetical protein [Rudaea sp.]
MVGTATAESTSIRPVAATGRLCTEDGVALAFEQFGSPGGQGLVFAHGFGQTRHAWNDTAKT